MSDDSLSAPHTDPTPIFEHFRGSYGTELLTVAVTRYDLFDRLAAAPRTLPELATDLALAMRPAVVLTTALRAMGLLQTDAGGRMSPTAIAREHLVRGGAFYVGDYVGLAAEAPGTVAMAERLRTNRPAGASSPSDVAAGDEVGDGTAFIYRAGTTSAMETEASARRLTLALAGRAKNVAPAAAERLEPGAARTLLDLGGGTGLYSIAAVRRHTGLRAVVFDRPEVLKVAAELVAAYGAEDCVELVAGDMFVDDLPQADLVLLSNVLHDWDVPECERLLRRAAQATRAGGRVLVHDVFLNDALDGPLPIALYSAALFTLTEGRAYSGAEYRGMLTAAGLRPGNLAPTAVHCGLLEGVKP